jgi:hypothetical protein
MRSLLTKLTTPVLVIAALSIGVTAIAQTGDTVKKGFTPPKATGTKQLPGHSHPTKPKQPIDPQPKGGGGGTGGGDSGYDAGGPGSGGGYIGDPNYGEGHKKF